MKTNCQFSSFVNAAMSLRVTNSFITTMTAVLTLTTACASVMAETLNVTSYPDKPIRIIVPAPAGGSTDVIARLIGQKLTETWHQPVVVDNRSGANTIIGNSAVAKSSADGYTILLGINSLLQTQFLYLKLPYDTFKDFTAVSLLAKSQNVFIVSASVPAKDLGEFITLVKANPKEYSYASYGAGTSSNLYGELLNQQAGLSMIQVPYRGSAPALNAVLAGEVKSAFVDLATARPHFASGRFKVLAVTGMHRPKELASVPTFTELGYKRYEPYGWFGVLVPSATPKEVVNKLSTEIARVVTTPEISKRLTDLGLQPVGSTPEDFEKMMKTDAAVWEKIIKDSGITLE